MIFIENLLHLNFPITEDFEITSTIELRKHIKQDENQNKIRERNLKMAKQGMEIHYLRRKASHKKVDTQRCLNFPKCSTLVQVVEVPLNRSV